MNLDTSVISEDCTEFIELVKVLDSLVGKSSDIHEEIEVQKSTAKVLKEMQKRFPAFDTIIRRIKGNTPHLKVEEKKSSVRLISTLKTKSLELVFGFLD